MKSFSKRVCYCWILSLLVTTTINFAIARADISGAVDPTEAIVCIAEDQMQTAIEKISGERAKLFTNVESVISLTEEYAAALQDEQPEFQYFALPDISFADAKDCFRTGLLSDLPLEETAALTVISKIVGHHGYCYPGDSAQIPIYAAAVSSGGVLRAILIYSINDPAAVMNEFLPVLKAPDSGTEEFVTALFPECISLDPPVLSDTEQAETLALLRLVSGTPESAEEVAVSLAKQIAARASEEDPVIQSLPEDFKSLALSCQVFSETPSRILRLSGDALSLPESLKESLTASLEESSEEYTFAISDEEYRDLLLASWPVALAGRYTGDMEMAASTLMEEATSASLPETGSLVLLLVYEGESGDVSSGSPAAANDPVVCHVSVILNENGCFDLTATPMFSESVTNWFLQVAQGGEYPWEK